MASSATYFYGTGRRKSAVARVRLYPGTGEIYGQRKIRLPSILVAGEFIIRSFASRWH